jgi:hypothetical protein
VAAVDAVAVAAPAASRRGRLHAFVLASLLLAAALAAVYLPFPLKGDTAMFFYAGRALAEGATLYVDFWDMKQPGVFWFYEAAVHLFGFREFGLRLLELVWMLALGGIALGLYATELRWRALLVAVPWFSVALAYGETYWNSVYNGQLEFLVALPIGAALLCALRAVQASERRRLAFVAAGACVGVVAVFKLLLSVVPAVLILLVVLQARRSRRAAAAPLAAGLAWSVLGLTLVLGAAAGWLSWQGAGVEAWWANIVYPGLALQAFPHAPPWRMRNSLTTFVEAMWPVLPFALIGAVDGLRRASVLTWALLLWCVVAGLAVLVQVLSWWIYHFALFVVPVGLLALLGIDAIVAWLGRRAGPAPARAAAVVLCLVALLPTVLLPTIDQVRTVWLSGPPPWADRAAFADRADPRNTQPLRRGAAFLAAPDAQPGPIALLGNPAILLVTDRRPLLAINGWTYYLPTQLEAAAETLRRERPPYLYRSTYLEHLHTNGSRALYDAVAALYVEHARDEARGVWYRLRGPGE